MATITKRNVQRWHFLHALGFDYQSRVPQIIQHSLDDWAKPGKRPMTITITNTVPPITKVSEIRRSRTSP